MTPDELAAAQLAYATNARPLRSLTLFPEYAALISLGYKQTETRPGPPNGPMRPPGVRAGVGGHAIEPHDRISVRAGAKLRNVGRHQLGPFELERERRGSSMLLRGDSLAWPYRLPTQASTSVARVFGAWPVEQVRFDPELETAPRGWVIDGDLLLVRPSEVPLGDFSPGRWVLPLYDVVRHEEVRTPGGQGFCAIPEAQSDLIEAMVCGVTARSIWEHCRTGSDMAGLFAKLPAWSQLWFLDVAADLSQSFDRIMAEIVDTPPGPGPYEAHHRDLAAGDVFKVQQRVWAQLRPKTEIPRRVEA